MFERFFLLTLIVRMKSVLSKTVLRRKSVLTETYFEKDIIL